MWVAIFMATAHADEVIKLGVVVVGSYVFPEVVSHVKLAMTHVNAEGFLPFALDFEYRNPTSAVGAALRAGVDVLPEVVGLIGTEMGETTLAVAQHASLVPKPVLTPFAPAPSLDEKSAMGIDSLFRTSLPDVVVARLVAAVARYYRWRELALVTSGDAAGESRMRVIEREFQKYGAPTVCTVVTYEIPDVDGATVDLTDGMRSLARSACRVALLWPHPEQLRQVIFSIAATGVTQDLVWFSVADPRNVIIPSDGFDMSLLRGWLFVQAAYVADSRRLARYFATYANDTQPYNCSETRPVFANIAEDPTILDFSLRSIYPNAPDFPDQETAPWQSCQNGNGIPGNESGTMSYLVRTMYDVVWIYAEAFRRMLDANATIQDVRSNGTWLEAELRATSFWGLWAKYTFNDNLDIATDVRMINIQETDVLVFETTDEFAADDLFYKNCTFCACYQRDCVRNVNPVEFPGNVTGDPPHDGRGINLERSRFLAQVLEVAALGAHVATLELFDYFGNPPFFGTTVTVQLVDSTVRWHSQAQLPGAGLANVSFDVGEWGAYEVVVTDVYSKEAIKLNVQAPRPLCPNQPGSVWNDEAQNCVECRAGREATAQGECAPCPAGWFRGDNSSTSCLPCPSDQYQDKEGQQSCIDCPANSQRYQNLFVSEAASEHVNWTFGDIERYVATSRDQCECLPGYYASDGPRNDASKDGASWGATGVACRACPEGGTCQGRTYGPQTQAGYWGDPTDKTPSRYAECEAGACKAGFECHQGYAQGSRLCARLKRGDFFTIAGIHPPFKCGRNHTLNYLVYALLFLGLFVFWMYVNLFCDLVAVKLLVEHLQMIAIISDFNVAFPDRAMTYLSLLYDFVLFDVDIVQPSCVVKWTGTSSFYLTMAMPFWGLVFYIPVVCLSLAAVLREATSPWTLWTGLCQDLRYYKGRHGAAAARATALAIELMYTLYPNICFVCIQMLVCDRADDGFSYSRMDPAIRCWTQRHRGPVVAAAFMIAIYIVGFPLGIVLVLQRHIRRAGGVHEPHLVARLGWLYGALASPHHTKCVVPMCMFVLYSVIYAVTFDGTIQLFLAFCLGLVLLILSLGTNSRAHERAEIHYLVCICQAILLLYVVTAQMLEKKNKREAWLVVVLVLLTLLFLSAGVVVLAELRDQRARNLALRAVRSQVSARGTLTSLRSMISVLTRWRSDESIEVLEPKVVPSDAATPRAILAVMRALNAYAHHALAAHELKVSQKDLIRRVACSCEATLDVTSPLSQLSGNSKARFWRSLAQNYPGIISFVANTLEFEERFVVFGVLCKLERFLNAAAPADRALDDIVDEPLRSSVLYALLSAPRRNESLAELLRMTLNAGSRPKSCAILWVPRSILDSKKSSPDHLETTLTRGQLLKSSKLLVARHISNFEYKEEAAVGHMENFIHIIRQFPMFEEATDIDDVHGMLSHYGSLHSSSGHDDGATAREEDHKDAAPDEEASDVETPPDSPPSA